MQRLFLAHARQEHRQRLDESRASLQNFLIETAFSHRTEKDRMSHENENKKDYETHRVDEQIRFARAMAELKKEFNDLTDEEIADSIQRYERSQGTASYSYDEYAESTHQDATSLDEEFEKFYRDEWEKERNN